MSTSDSTSDTASGNYVIEARPRKPGKLSDLYSLDPTPSKKEKKRRKKKKAIEAYRRKMRGF